MQSSSLDRFNKRKKLANSITVINNEIDDNLVDIQNRYASKINIERVLLDKKENVLISTDLKQQEYTPLQITQNNIKELLTNRMKTNLVDQENITEAMLILEDILNA